MNKQIKSALKTFLASFIVVLLTAIYDGVQTGIEITAYSSFVSCLVVVGRYILVLLERAILLSFPIIILQFKKLIK